MIIPFPDQNGFGSQSKHDTLIERLVSDTKKEEALEWTRGGKGEARIVGDCKTSKDSSAFVQNLYDMGAVKVWAVHMRANRRKAKGKRTGKLVVELPQDESKRREIFNWCEAQGDLVGYSPDPDRGESHLFLLLE